MLVDTQYWNYPPSDGLWREHYGRKKGIDWEEPKSLEDLVRRFRSEIKGVVLYDADDRGAAWNAVTLAGIEGALPATESLAKSLGDLPVIDDFRGRWKTEGEATDWGIENLSPRCEKGIGLSVQLLWSGLSIDTIDYAVMRKAFVFPLHPKADDSDDPGRAWRIMKAIGPMAMVLGWAEPEEDYARHVSLNGNYILCSEAPNLSFHAAVPCGMKEFKQVSRFAPPPSGEPEAVHYVAFLYSEGDSAKIHVTHQGGAWVHPARGKVPINWGAQPLLTDIAPALMEFYYTEATQNDYFVCGPSGAGYLYPNHVPEPDEFFRHTGKYLKKADVHEIECWLHYTRPTYERFAELSGARGFTMPCGPLGPSYLEGNVPVLKRGSILNYFGGRKTPKDFVDAIHRQTKDLPVPSFNHAFVVPDNRNSAAQGGFSPGELEETARMLDPKKYKVVTMEEMTWAATKLGPKNTQPPGPLP